jgi:hypothetical protein
MPLGAFSRLGHSVGLFGGLGACRGFLWLPVGLSLLGAFWSVGGRGITWGGRESVGVGRLGVGRVGSGLATLALSQIRELYFMYFVSRIRVHLWQLSE